MRVDVAIVAEPAAAAIAGLEGSFDWGDASLADPGAPVADAGLLIALGAAFTGGREPDARWLGDRAAASQPRTPEVRTRLLATSGEGLWSRAAWPVRDELFDLAAPEPAAGLLVVAPDAEQSAPLLEKLAARGIPHRAVPELTADALATAAAVAFPPRPPDGEDGYVPGARQDALPAAVFAPLAARRPLIAPRARLTLGLLPGVDHLAASTDDDVVQYADALHAFLEAFAPQVALARIASERQRASIAYGRLVADIEADEPR